MKELPDISRARQCVSFASLLVLGMVAILPGCKKREAPITVIGAPAASADGDRVAFFITRQANAKSRDMDSHLWVVDVNSRAAADTGAELLAAFYPLSWSPDGKSLVYTSGRNDNFAALEQLELGPMTTRQLAPPTCFAPQYSPNGKYVGYISRNGNDSLAVLDLDNGQMQVLATDVNQHYWCWAPDGSAVFYIRDSHIYRRSPGGGDAVLVYGSAENGDQKASDLSHLVCSPDGSQLGFYQDGCFRVSDLDSGQVRQLFQCDHYFLDFDWSAAGICYLDQSAEERRNEAKLMVCEPTSAEVRHIATGPFSQPSWLNDNQIVLRYGDKQLWVHTLETSQGELLVSPPEPRP